MQSLETKSSKPRPKSLETEAWDLWARDRDFKKRVSRHVSRPSLETTSLLVCAKKVCSSNRLKCVFLCLNSRITSNIFKTCFGQSEQVWMDEKLVKILLFEIQRSAFVFLNLLIYHLLIANLWRILNQLLVVWGEKYRKGVGNVTKNGKALLVKIHEICGEEIWVSVQMPSVRIKRM